MWSLTNAPIPNFVIRLSLGGGALHVFYFNFDGDQCLLKVVSYEEDDYKLSLGK